MNKIFKFFLVSSWLMSSTFMYGAGFSGGGTGTVGDPYKLATLADLNLLSTTSSFWAANIYFEQTADIDASATSTLNSNGTGGYYGFSPIGNNTTKFLGTYDGKGFKITNLYINRPITDYIGLFGFANSGSVINNVKLLTCNITGNNFVGSCVGSCVGQFTNCSSTGSVSGSENNIGGLIGYANTSIVTDCNSACTVSTLGTIPSASSYGGLIGFIKSADVSNCFSTGSVTANSLQYVGGFVGFMIGGTITKCYSTGNVIGYQGVGGFVGYGFDGTPLFVADCYSMGNVTGTDGVGGFAGNIDFYGYTELSFSRCYSRSVVTGVTSTNGFGGTLPNNKLTDCYFDADIDGLASTSGTNNYGVIGKSTAEMKTQSTFTGWDFATPIWSIISTYNGGYPNLEGMTESLVISWTGASSTDWNTAGNWSTGSVPTASDNVTIPDVTNDPLIVSGVGANCNNLTVNSGANLIVNSGGSLITNGSITNNGTISIKRDMSASTWHLVSSPVTSATASIFLGDYLQSWSEGSHTWTDITNPDASLQPLHGYGLWATPSKAPSASYTFNGTPNTGNQSQAISFTEYSSDPLANEGANLLGNPYPSAIDWEGLRTTYGAVYYYNGSMYVSWNGSGTGSRYIPTIQGFFIVTESNGTFSLTNANRTHTMSGYYKSAEETKENLLVLETESIGISDKLYVNFNDQATGDFDLQHDAYKFASGTAGLSELYSYTGDKKLSIDVRPVCDVVQLGFANSEGGTYSIAISQLNGISKATLEDTKTNTFNDLLKGAYSFSWLAGEDDKRFKLHMGTVGFEETPDSEIGIYSYQQTAYINLKDKITGDIYIYNMAGQLITSRETAIGLVCVGINAPGIYIVKVVSDKKTTTDKIFIQ